MCYKQNITAEEEVPKRERGEGREGRGEMEERRERGREGGREGGRERGRKVGERDEPWLANKMYQHVYLSEESLKS